MDATFAITTVVTIGLAFIGYIVTYLNNLRLTMRTERLARINRQLAEFYGPLFALTAASQKVWVAFRSKYRLGKKYFDTSEVVSPEEMEAWRLWIKTVFMPINIKLYELVLTKSDLLIEAEMPECLLLLCANVASYQAVIKKWEENNYSEHTALINFPGKELLEYSQSSFKLLKSEQNKLIGYMRYK